MMAHILPPSARFTFNCYTHFSQLLIQFPGNQTPRIILIKEGFTQGDLMTMPLYGVSMAVLDEHLKRELPEPMQV